MIPGMYVRKIWNARRGYVATSLGAAVGAIGAWRLLQEVTRAYFCGEQCIDIVFLLIGIRVLGTVAVSVAVCYAALKLRGHQRAGRTAAFLAALLPLTLFGLLHVVIMIPPSIWLWYDLDLVLLPLVVIGYAFAARRLAIGARQALLVDNTTRKSGQHHSKEGRHVMTAPTVSVGRTMPPDGGRRTAALWVAGVGAALLVVAAGLFVAVRWNDLPPEAKLAVILGLTGAFLLAGSTLRRTLPATGSVLFHLGAFLLPVDLGAINLKIGLSWEELLLAEGILGVVAFGGLGLLSRSVVLQRAAAVSVAAVALGVGATTPVPAPLALAVAAAGFSIRFPRSPAAVAWAAGAGFMPAFALALDAGGGIAGPLTTLGFGAASQPLAALGTGALSALVLGRAAHLDPDVGLAFVGIGAFVTSAITAWVGTDLPRAADELGVPAAFVVIELIAVAVERDAFWRRPARWIAGASEILVLLVAVGTLGFVAYAPFVEDGFFGSTPLAPDRVAGLAFGLLAVGSLVSSARYGRAGDALLRRLAFLGAGLFAVAAVQAGTVSALGVATAMVTAAAALSLARHPLTDAGAVAAALYAPLTAHSHPAGAFMLAGAGAACLTWTAFEAGRLRERVRAGLVAGAAVTGLGFGAIFGADAFIIAPLAGLTFVFGCWLVAAFVDAGDRGVAFVPRLAALAVLVPAAAWASPVRLYVVLPLVALLAFDALRNAEPRIAFAAVVPLQVAVWDVARIAGLPVPHVGVVLCVAAIVWAGLAEAVGGGWRGPFVWAAGTGVGFGILAASSDPAALGAALIVSGGLGLAAGLLGRNPALAHTGAAAMTVGVWIELATGGVAVAEAYLAPVAVHLLAAGAWARRTQPVSSWAAYAPATAILGGAGVIERMSGGPGWHAVLAGVVGVASVAAGGWRRLAGPLVTGTVLLGVVVGYESLAVAATVPTWAWLALGGSMLLATGVALERTDTSPVEAGRRVVEVISANFD